VKINFTWNFYDGNQTDFIFDDSKIIFTENSATLISSGDTSNPYIINAEGIDYTFLSKLTGTVSQQTSGSQIRLQLSNDADTWYYYDRYTTTWLDSTLTESDLISGSNLFTDITKQIFEKFTYDVDAGKLFFKAYFINDGMSDSPQLSNINFTGDKYYTNIKEVRGLLESFGLRQCDPVTGLVDPMNDFLSDDRLKNLVPLADSYINNYTFTDFYYHRDETEFHDGNGKDSIRTYNFPIHKITRVIMYNPLLQAMRTFLDFELIIHPEWGEIFLPPIYPAYMSDSPARSMFGNIFIHGRRNIEIEYDWGYVDTPEDISNASKKLVGINVLNAYWANLTRGMQSKSFDGYSESYGQKPFAGIVEAWQKEVNDILIRRIKISPRSI
jgi:hypothetical protein